MKFGQVFERDGKAYAKFPNGRKTASGNTSYTVRRVSSKTAGERFLREIRKAMLAGSFADNGATRQQGADTVADAVERYIAAKIAEGRAAGTIEQYRVTLKAVRAHSLGAHAVGRVTADDVRGFLAWRRSHVWQTRVLAKGKVRSELVKGATASNAVLYRDRGLLSAVYRWLVDEGVMTANPVRRVKPPKRKQTTKRPFERAEIAQFLEECHPVHLRPLVVCGLYTGLGEDELVNLTWRDVSLPRASLSVVRKKTGKSTEIPLHAHVVAELTALREQRAREGGIPAADESVFLSRYARPFRAFPKGAWNGALRRAGLAGRGLTPHSLRRTFATYYEGQDRDLQEILGHADLATTLIYRRSRDDRKRAGVDSLDFGLGAEVRHTNGTHAAKAE